MLAVLGGLADVERDLIRIRTAEGRARAIEQGGVWAVLGGLLTPSGRRLQCGDKKGKRCIQLQVHSGSVTARSLVLRAGKIVMPTGNSRFHAEQKPLLKKDDLLSNFCRL